MDKERLVSRKAALAGVLFSLVYFPPPSSLAANALDGKAARNVVADKTWQVDKPTGPGYDYFTWSADGSVCVRLSERTGKCTDTGRWKLDGERLCYEFPWWGATSGIGSACFRVVQTEKERFSAMQDNGLSLFEFSLAK